AGAQFHRPLARRVLCLFAGIGPHRGVAGVGDAEDLRDRHTMLKMVRLDVLRRFADSAGTETGAGAIGDAAVVWHAVDGPVDRLIGGIDLIEKRKAAERRHTGKAGKLSRIGKHSLAVGHADTVPAAADTISSWRALRLTLIAKLFG